MYHSLNSLKGGYIGDYIGGTIRPIKGDHINPKPLNPKPKVPIVVRV